MSIRAIFPGTRLWPVLWCAVFFPGWAGSAADYLRDVKPVLAKRCYSCHGALQQKAGLRLDTAEAIRKGSRNGPVFQPSDPAASELLRRVTSRDPDQRMPPEGEALGADEAAALRSWLESGGSGPAGEESERDPRAHWAFQEVRRPPVPAVKRANGVRNPVDAFILREHEARGLSVREEAKPEVLLRRVHLDLTGLPPTREEFAAFLADPSHAAYERVVDRLLDSPRHGERWARHWMDVWRYADWYGRRSVPDVWNSAPQIWRWRDWIIRSLNEDKGYDRMLTEMLAADEVSPDDDEAGVATGFLVRSWYALNPNQWRRDMVEHAGKAFLGLTFNCAHCHDHKYDPISHREYFQFRAFFEPLGLRQDWVRGEPDPGPFQRYDYSTLRKIVRHGSVRVLDEEPGARTYVYLRGDERAFPPHKPTVEPAVPAFLRFTNPPIREVALPATVHHPSTKPWIRESLREQSRTNLVAAGAALVDAEKRLALARAESQLPTNAATQLRRATVLWSAENHFQATSNRVVMAQAEFNSVEARLAADEARFGVETNATTVVLMTWAAHAERFAALRRAEAAWAESQQALVARQAEYEMSAVRRQAEGVPGKSEQEARAKEEEALGTARERSAALARTVDAANAALNTNTTSYTSLGPSYPPRSSGRRRALAEWLAHPRNPLTARVAVNHVWSRHFHAPLVSTVFDFGRNGAAPTHPELLDWLAAEFVEHGFSLKHLHRLILTSRTYCQASGAGDAPSGSGIVEPGSPMPLVPSTTARRIDPDNRFLWRANIARLESEIVRDCLLSVAGELDPTIGGPVLPNTEAGSSRRRTIYHESYPEAGGSDAFTGTFDPPDPAECYRRSSTILPQQALAMVNAGFTLERSRSAAARIWGTLTAGERAAADRGTAFIEAAFETVLSRRPGREELEACQDFLASQTRLLARPGATVQPGAESGGSTAVASRAEVGSDPSADAVSRARENLVHALFSHNDFVSIR